MARLAMLAALAAAGCASGGFTVHSTHSLEGRGSTGFLSLASAPVVDIRGTPPGGTTPEAVAASLRMPSGFPQQPFRVAGPNETGTRLVLIFGAQAVNDATACGPSAGGGASATLRAAGVLCVNNRVQASGVVSSGATSAADPTFAAALQALLTGMVRADDRPRQPFTVD
jgi:hypothetical protein